MDTPALPLTGRCQCGGVTYAITGAPIRVTGCHCMECQRQSGSAFGLALWVRPDDLRVTGAVKRHTRIADSGRPITGVFCPDCGVRLYNIPSYDEDVFLLKPGTLDDTSWLRPERMVWLRRRQGWVVLPGDIETVD